MANNSQEQNLFLKILKEVYKKLYILLIAVFLCAGAGLTVYFAWDKPTYTATKTVMLITNLAEDEMLSQPSIEADLAKLYLTDVAFLIKTPTFVEAANKKYAENMSLAESRNYISGSSIDVKYQQNSLIFTISYTDAVNQNMNQKLEAIIESASENLDGKIMAFTPKLESMQVGAVIEKNSNLVKDIFIGAGIGLILGLGIIYLTYSLDNTVRDKEEFERLTGVICLSHIEDVAIVEEERQKKEKKQAKKLGIKEKIKN